MFGKVEENRLPEQAIKEGNIIWYSGNTSTFGWDCPAVIIDVNEEARTFRVISLDDCKEQKQVYDFDVDGWTCDSRTSMHVPSDEKLAQALEEEGINFRSTGVSENNIDETSPWPITYWVELQMKKSAPIIEWIVSRWAARNHISKDDFGCVGVTRAVMFKRMDDAVLFNIAFSSGVPWDKLR
jgi:hypothetical protein